MGKGKQLGICSICGLNKELTFEHLPPKAAKNDQPIKMKDYRHLMLLPNENPHLYGQSSTLSQGMGGHKLCASCNNNTGGYYANDYALLVKDAFPFIIAQRDEAFARFSLEIKPLNVFKQVIIFHLCADQAVGAIHRRVSDTNFILDKFQKELSSEIRVFMYATLSSTHRMLGTAALYYGWINRIATYSEFSFHPFGFLLSLNSAPAPLNSMMEITNFKDYDYGTLENITFDLPLLDVKGHLAGTYP